MKEKITLYKQIDKYGNTHVNAIKLLDYKVLAQVEVEVEFPRYDSAEAQRSAIREAIAKTKGKHQNELAQLEKELKEV